jgi:hypothetical protein
MRERGDALVAAGLAVCARCSRPILEGQPFDLDHTPDRTGYIGVSHRRCNRRAGGMNGAAVTNSRRPGSAVPSRYVRTWSRVWEWPIPPDTYVDAEVVRAYLDEEASRCAPVGPPES